MLSSQARVLGEFLVERHVLSRDDLPIARAESRRRGGALPAVRRGEGLVSEKDLTAAIAETVGVRFVDFTETPLHPDAALTVPEAVAREFQAIGVDFDETRLVVAFPDPGDDAAVQAVGQATGYEIVPAAATRSSTPSTRCSAQPCPRSVRTRRRQRATSTRSRTRSRASTSTTC